MGRVCEGFRVTRLETVSKDTKDCSGKSDSERLWKGWLEAEIKCYRDVEEGVWKAEKGGSSRMESPLLSCPCHWPSSISTYYSDAGMPFDRVTGGSLIQNQGCSPGEVYIVEYHEIVITRTLSVLSSIVSRKNVLTLFFSLRGIVDSCPNKFSSYLAARYHCL